MRQKKSVENIMRLILEEVIMSDRHMSDEQFCLFLQLFFNTEKISLNRRLDSTVTDYVFLIFIVIPLWWIASLLIYMSIRHKTRKKIMHLDWVLFFLLTQNFSFWLRILKNNAKWCIKMVRTSNKSTYVLKNKFHLSIRHNMLWKIFGKFF